ncbi:MAG: AraC family transcriptional regulator [Marinoscillum sp.]|jgi:AraC-like DNA-binding protein
MGYLIDSVPVKNENSLFTLVENRTAFSFDTCEMNVFETHQQALNVDLVFNDFVLTSMLQGKKVMKLDSKPRFDYFPGESVIVAPGERMQIDFPEAAAGNPTQCIALEISKDLIQSTMDLLNEYHPKILSNESWKLDAETFHLINNMQLADTINRMLRISQYETGKSKDIIIDLTLKEMLVRLMQTQARRIFENNYATLSAKNPLAHAIDYIKSNLDSKLEIEEIAKKAYMSRASFFKKFKEELGLTPAQYILNERLKLAKNFLETSNHSISQICFYSGFENLSHFITVFKKHFSDSPGHYRSSLESDSLQ